MAVRYPRGKEKEHSVLKPGGDFKHDAGSETLVMTYGRFSEQASSAVEKLHASGIPCGFLRLTKIFPIPQEALAFAA